MVKRIDYMKITIKTPTKINIVLRVTGKRANGYHDLLMLNEKLNLCDEITIEAEKKTSLGSKRNITTTSSDPSVPTDETNICYKAANALLDFAKDESHNVKIHILKRIPVAAGLGGGSSDGAAVLLGLNEILNLGFDNSRLAQIGVKLGADVPFFLYDGPAICEGIGDQITTLEKLPNMWIILINPNFPVSTKWVYEEFDKLRGLQLTEENQGVSSLPLPARVVVAGRHFKGLDGLAKVVHNDLELVTAKKFPEIEQIKKLLVECGAIKSWMSGSGPTVIGMFGSEKICADAAKKIRSSHSGWRVIETTNVFGGE